MIPNFLIFEDELERLEILAKSLSKPEAVLYSNHLILIIEDRDNHENKNIIGGISCEYYPKSNCALMTYIAVNPLFRQYGFAKILVSHVLDSMNYESIKIGYDKCHALYLETNSDKIDSNKDVMDPAIRRKILYNLGFRILKFNYIQPPLSINQNPCKDLLLAVHESYVEDINNRNIGIKSKYLLKFIEEFFNVLIGDNPVVNPDLISIRKELQCQIYVPIFKVSI